MIRELIAKAKLQKNAGQFPEATSMLTEALSLSARFRTFDLEQAIENELNEVFAAQELKRTVAIKIKRIFFMLVSGLFLIMDFFT